MRFSPPFCVRYVDDLALAAPSSLLCHTLDTFNSFHPCLQFTIEIGSENTLNFLDVTLILQNNRLIFDWFYKATFSGRYLSFLSQHPVCQKRGTVIGLIDRAFLLFHTSFHKKNKEFIIQILLNNCYPLNFIFRIFHERLKTLITDSRSNNKKIGRTDWKIWPFFHDSICSFHLGTI